MFLSIFLLLISVLGLRLLWFFWKNRDRYFGTENRHKYFAKEFKDAPIFHNAKTLPMKKKLFESLENLRKPGKDLRILEIGAGPGANLQFYPKNTKLTVVDPNPFFKEYLEENLEKFSHVTLDRYVVSGAENMKGVEDNSFDAVVSTLVLCSCDQLDQVFKEICRVLTPGGNFLFMEHVIDDKPLSIIKILQVLVSQLGIFPLICDGCRCDKNLDKDIRKSGLFADVKSKRFRLDLSEGMPLEFWPVYLIVPHLFGSATAP